MNNERRLDKIIEEHLPAIRNGQETLDSILSMFPEDANMLRPRLEAARWIAKIRVSLEPRPGFITSSRKYLEQRLKSTSPTSALQRLFARYTPQRWVFNFTAPIILALLFALIVNSLVLTARLSIPGEPFYSTKLLIEDLQVTFTTNPERKMDLYIQFSRERSSEFVELVLEGDYQLLHSAADRMETDIIAALRALEYTAAQNPNDQLSMINDLYDTLSTEIVMLRVLADTSPKSAQQGIDLAIQAAQSGIMALR
ncbi:MAG TPA: DUF5667 domain-containing protein [Anaerolineales bacterium]|nr:DUF5667 domain-containing protein [Anaerolineales bacterium]